MDFSNRTIGQQYNLKWTNHTNNIIHMFEEQLINEALVDVTLSCEGQLIKAHRMILSACSPYFKELFQVYTTPNPLIIVNGAKFGSLKHVVEFMYQGEVRVFDSDLDNFLSVAENLQVKGLCNVRGRTAAETTPEKHGLSGEESCESVSKKRKISVNKDDVLMNSPTVEEQIQKISEPNPLLSFLCESNSEKDQTTAETTQTDINGKESQIETQTEETPKSASKVNRPPNAFMIFLEKYRQQTAEQYPNESNKERFVRLSIMWKTLSAREKIFYYEEATKLEKEHMKKHPNYKPKENKGRNWGKTEVTNSGLSKQHTDDNNSNKQKIRSISID